MLKEKEDITGKRFGRLTVLCKSDQRSGFWTCKCDCGNIKDMRGYDLRRGKCETCGCRKTGLSYVPHLKKPYGLHSTGDKIRYIRERKRISKSDLSQACNVSPAALNHWEIGIRTPSEEVIVNLAKVMNIDAASLFDRRIRTMVDVAHILFEMADDGFIEPESGDIRVMNRTLFEVMLQWHEKYQQWKSGQITNEEYYDWQDSFTLATTDSETK